MKLPLQVILPLGSAIVGGGIAVGIGLTNLEIADAFSHTEPVIFAAGLGMLVVAIAAFLSARYPDPDDADHH